MLTPEIITNALKSVKYPGFSRDIVSFGLVKDVAANDGVVSVLIQLTSSNAQAARQIKEDCDQALKAVPGMKCDLSWETVEKTLEYKPIDVVHQIAPRARLLIGARDDNVCPIEGYEKLYERACEPKRLVVLPIEHYDIYAGKWFDESARLAREWFERFLH